VKTFIAVGFLAVSLASPAVAQMPVIDSANLQQALQTATNTRSIMGSNEQIKTLTNQVLTALTGDRSGAAGQFAAAALGQGFNVSQAPNLGQILSSGNLSWGGMAGGGAQSATELMNALRLVRTLSGLITGNGTTQDQSYQRAVSAATALAGLIASTQSASQTRASAFSNASNQIGRAQDLKASIDQNSQLVVQGSQTTNELIGAINNVLTAQNVRNTQDIALQSSTASAMAFDGSRVTFGSR
jgi:hypothetical protein